MLSHISTSTENTSLSCTLESLLKFPTSLLSIYEYIYTVQTTELSSSTEMDQSNWKPFYMTVQCEVMNEILLTTKSCKISMFK